MASVCMTGLTLYHRGELQEAAADAVAKEAVESQRLMHIGLVDSGHGIPFHTIFIEHLYGTHHTFPGATAGCIEAIGIVHGLGTVDAKAHQPMFLGQETAPLGSEQQSVGLQAVVYTLATTVIALEPDSILIEGERAQKGFATMPGKLDIRHLLHLYIALDELLQHLARHAARTSGKEILLLGIVTIPAAQVALGPCGLCHHVQRAGEGIDVGHVATASGARGSAQATTRQPSPPPAR